MKLTIAISDPFTERWSKLVTARSTPDGMRVTLLGPAWVTLSAEQTAALVGRLSAARGLSTEAPSSPYLWNDGGSIRLSLSGSEGVESWMAQAVALESNHPRLAAMVAAVAGTLLQSGQADAMNTAKRLLQMLR
jgi:hypothetical protein